MEESGKVIITGNSNGSLQLLHYLPQKPAYAAMMPRFKNFVEGLRSAGSVPDEIRPEWQQEQMGMQISGGPEGGSTWLAQSWFPFEETLQLGTPLVGEPEEGLRRLASSARPGLKFIAEAATGTNIFKGTPLKPMREMGAAGPLKALQGRSGTALDTIASLRPLREWGPGGRVATMSTAGSAATRAVLGGALQPIDYQRGLLGRYYELQAMQQQLRAQYNRALNARDYALAQQLLEQWTAIMQQMYQYQFPVSRTMEQTMQDLNIPRPGPPRG